MKRVLLAVACAFACALAHAQDTAASKQETSQLLKLEQDYFATKARHTNKPTDKTKAAYVAATVKFGTASMTAASLAPKVKYRRALRLYREALKFDPKNKEALNNKAMIESIYKSMGRPIPQ